MSTKHDERQELSFTPLERNRLILPLSAGLSGIVEACTTHPLDRIKTEMQRLTLVRANSSLPAGIQSIYKTGGLPNFYAGIVPRLIGIIPMRLVYWATLNSMNEATVGQEKYIQYFLPGITAGFAQTLIDNPIEVFKVKLMTGAKQVQFNTSTLYVGFRTTLARNIVFAICVGITTKTFGTEYPFLAGAIGGCIGSLASQPLDVVKTELQRHQTNQVRKSALQILKEVYSVSPLNLWAGGSMRCALGFANMGVGFLALSHIQTFLSSVL